MTYMNASFINATFHTALQLKLDETAAIYHALRVQLKTWFVNRVAVSRHGSAC